MARISSLFRTFAIAAVVFTSAACFANEESIEFKSFFCTSLNGTGPNPQASNTPHGVTTLSFTGRNPLNGKDTFSLSTGADTSSPTTQTLLLSGFNHSGTQLQLNFRTVLTNSEMSLHLNSATNLIQLDMGNGLPLIAMTCKVNMDVED